MALTASNMATWTRARLRARGTRGGWLVKLCRRISFQWRTTLPDSRQRSSKGSRLNRHAAFPRRRSGVAWCVRLAVRRQSFVNMTDSFSQAVCSKMERSPPGAQTERRGGAGPVRGLLGGKASPAALFVRPSCSLLLQFQDFLRLRSEAAKFFCARLVFFQHFFVLFQ